MSTLPAPGIVIFKGPQGGLSFSNSWIDGKPHGSGVLLSKARKDEVHLVITALGQSQLFGRVASDSKANLIQFVKSHPEVLGKYHLIQTERKLPLPKMVCSMAGCSQSVSRCNGYCGRHFKYEFLSLCVESFRQKGNSFGVGFTMDILNECLDKKANPLKPNVAPNSSCTPPVFRDNASMLEFFLPYLPVLHAPLGVLIDSNRTSKKVMDQQCRAECLVNMLRAHHSTVRLMDGRCGFLLLFMKAVRERYGAKYLNSLKIELVDIDDSVTQWHKKFYRCPTFHCTTENVLSLKAPLPDTTLLYLNFCGISKSFDLVREYLKTYRIECMISFSVARRAAVKDYGKSLISLKGRFLKKLPSERKDFETWVVALTKNGAERGVDV